MILYLFKDLPNVPCPAQIDSNLLFRVSLYLSVTEGATAACGV